MLLENFKRSCYGGGNAATGNTPWCVDIAGNQSNYSTLNFTSNPTTANYYSTSGYGWYVNVGFGDTAEDKDDYKLAVDNIVDSNLALTFVSSSINYKSNAFRSVVTNYVNNSGSDLTVKEIGLIGKSYTTANETRRNVMIARKVLDTPVVVPAGASVSLTYSLELDWSESVSVS